MTISALPEASLHYVEMKQPKRSQLCRGAQTGFHLSYITSLLLLLLFFLKPTNTKPQAEKLG